jgi:serine/threonine-protein kinase
MVASRWIIGGLLGQSERAQVYEAEEAQRSRFAALKILAPVLSEGPRWNDYVNLTKTLAELPGDGIARAYDIGFDSVIERPYVATERLVFPTLSRYVAERGPAPLRALAQSLETLAGALDAAHAVGIVHGGLKPQNVFVSFDNPRWARITDFALGRLRSESGGGPGSLLGWSAPEATTGEATAASDRYSLALLCFFAATGTPWYSALRRTEGGEDASRASRRASERAKSFGGELDPAFDAWFERALAFAPEARFPSAREMADSFRTLFSGSLVPPPPSAVHPFAATRPVPFAEQPTVPVQQVGSTSAPPPKPSSPPARPAELDRTLPLRSSENPPAVTSNRPSKHQIPTDISTSTLKLLAFATAAGVALVLWWWLR